MIKNLLKEWLNSYQDLGAKFIEIVEEIKL